MSGELLFPWWLWLLACLWSAALVIHGNLAAASDWKWPLRLLTGAYTGLLVYVASWNAQHEWSWGQLGRLADVGLAFTTMSGGLVAVLAHEARWQAAGQAMGTAAIAGWMSLAGAMESALLVLLAGGLSAAATWKADTTAKETSVANSRPLPHRVVLIVTCTVCCVLFLGGLSFAFRYEMHRPSSSLWYTAIPDVEHLARGRAENGRNPVLSPTAVLLVATVLSIELLRRRTTRTLSANPSAMSRTRIAPDEESIA